MAGQYTTRGSDCLSEKLFKGESCCDRKGSLGVNLGGQQANINIAPEQSSLENAQKNTEFSIDSQFEGA
jgi:hypothetical protein